MIYYYTAQIKDIELRKNQGILKLLFLYCKLNLIFYNLELYTIEHDCGIPGIPSHCQTVRYPR